MHRIVRSALGGGVVALLFALAPLTASAHEVREVGDYELVVGFLEEPAFVGEKNGLDLRVTNLAAAPTTPAAGGEEASGAPVEGLADTLQAEVIYGDQTMELELEPRFGEPGAYRGILFPTAEGDYTFRIFGEIEGTAIDESFTSSPEGFSAVEPREPLEFPKEESSRTGGAAATIGGDAGGSSAGSGGLAALAGIGAALALAAVGGRRLSRRRAAALVPVRS